MVTSTVKRRQNWEICLSGFKHDDNPRIWIAHVMITLLFQVIPKVHFSDRVDSAKLKTVFPRYTNLYISWILFPNKIISIHSCCVFQSCRKNLFKCWKIFASWTSQSTFVRWKINLFEGKCRSSVVHDVLHSTAAASAALQTCHHRHRLHHRHHHRLHHRHHHHLHHRYPNQEHKSDFLVVRICLGVSAVSVAKWKLSSTNPAHFSGFQPTAI